jgi:cytochrome c
VLDQHPRMVTLALSDEMWVAYDATHCGLYKAWKGGVHFDGPVYTTVHGPQPTTQGTAYVDGIEGDVWSVNGEVAKARWKGYRFNGEHVALEYEIPLADGRKVAVQEAPEFTTPEQMMDEAHVAQNGLVRGRPGFLRNFLARDLPDGVEVSVRIPTGKAKVIANPPMSGQDLRLSKARPQASLALFFEPIPDAPKETSK